MDQAHEELTVPLHRELKRGTLSGILNDAGLDPDQLLIAGASAPHLCYALAPPGH